MANNITSDFQLVLVVDDDTVIADTLVQILNHWGFAAYATYDGESAIEAALLAPPRLVISDVMMPGMSGVELGVAIRRIFPDCKVILSSGVAASRHLISAALSAGNHFTFLEKPIPLDVLQARVKEALKQG